MIALEGAATGIGSWPGTDMREALRIVRDELPDLPHLPELPARGPGADLIGRGAALLVGLPVELQPHGWRLVDHPGRDARRAAGYLHSDLDEMAEAFDGYDGPLKVQLTGPWTLAASLWLARGERALTDPGARRDLVESLAAGVAEHVAQVRGSVPGAQLVVQIDEPSLPVVLAGRLPTASGYGVVRAVEASDAEQGLAAVFAAATAVGASTAVHCCAPDVPIALLQRAGAQAISVDLSLLPTAGWDAVAEASEAGVALWAGAVPSRAGVDAEDTPDGFPQVSALVEAIRRPWVRLGLPIDQLTRVVVTPTCGLASATPQQARTALRRAVAAARALTEVARET